MENIIPSDIKTKEDYINTLLDEGNLRSLLITKAALKSEIRDIDELIAEKRVALHEKMTELNLSELSLNDDLFIRNIQPAQRDKIMSVSQLRKQFPDLVSDLVSVVSVKGYVQVKLKLF